MRLERVLVPGQRSPQVVFSSSSENYRSTGESPHPGGRAVYTAKCSLSRPGLRLGRAPPGVGGDWAAARTCPQDPQVGCGSPSGQGPVGGLPRQASGISECDAGGSGSGLLWRGPLGCEGWGKGVACRRGAGAVPGGYGGLSHPRTRGGGMTASVPGETADVPARALGACGLVVVQAVWAAPCSPVSPERHIEPASSSASRKDGQRHGLQFLPSPLSHATSGSCGHGRPLPSAAPRAVWATTCLDGSPGRWAHSGPLERLLGSVGSSWGQPRACRGHPGRAVPCRVCTSGTTAGLLHLCSRSFPGVPHFA
ncbi:uncharacterized protein LOC133750665 [Lepus europaeus]|uniref:uncharacterized protein LOC133750665 n=1 Tax=Lepus europaeus TaxID=9983 RepID=UPI002B498217|nr:uncharacterized protein LOC133750665 [Lepus europaeus]